MVAHQIVPCEARNPDELGLDAIERFLLTPDRIPTVNDLGPEIETVSDPLQSSLVVPDVASLFADWNDKYAAGSSSSEGTRTAVGVERTGLDTQGCVKEQLGPFSNDCYYEGETGGCVPVNEASVWRASNCLCCQVLREIIHSNGEMVTTKLEIHGRVGMICHAILEHRHYFTDRPVESLFQFIDYSNKCLEQVKRSLEEYCAGKEREGFFIQQDSLSMFYETLCVGYDWNENTEEEDHSPTAFGVAPHPPPPLPLPLPLPREENAGGKKPPKTNLSQQRERAAKLKYQDLAQYLDYPIQEAARLLNLCPTVLKKICRQEGVPRWPHRKVKSLKKQMEQVREFMNSNVYNVEQYASLQDSLNRLQLELEITVAGRNNV